MKKVTAALMGFELMPGRLPNNYKTLLLMVEGMLITEISQHISFVITLLQVHIHKQLDFILYMYMNTQLRLVQLSIKCVY